MKEEAVNIKRSIKLNLITLLIEPAMLNLEFQEMKL